MVTGRIFGLAACPQVVTTPLTTHESWTALSPGELKVFVEGTLAEG
ncbi:MAG: class II glutamine amidotransferase [Burkholderiales bacterium]|nr:class II glutamine amidotransferase [Burkholderiales bacterium]